MHRVVQSYAEDILFRCYVPNHAALDVIQWSLHFNSYEMISVEQPQIDVKKNC